MTAALAAAVFLASLMGSLHCAGMCGAFVAFAVGLDAPSDHRRRAHLQLAYNLGRLLTYTTLGIIAGTLGSAFNSAGELIGLQRAAVIFAGASMVIFGSIAILRLSGFHIPRAPVPSVMQRAATSLMRAAMEKPPLLRAALTGLTTTLLPCGWLYAFVITAAATGHPLTGALTMAIFWTGTLPILIAIGTGIQSLAAHLGRFGKRVPIITASLVVLIGLFNVFASLHHTFNPETLIRTATPDSLIQRVQALSDSGAACCHDHPQPQ